MEKHFFEIQCGNCTSRMKYHSPTKILGSKRKRCVFCGKSFRISNHIVAELGCVM